jgi:cytochrome b6
MMLLAVQFLTGILLMVYYVPDLQAAHASILKINTGVDFGWFIRSMHSWGANLMILALFAHFFSTYFMKAYRAPREITWLSGCILLILIMGFGFTGYLLPWDEVAFFASKIGLDIAGKVPLIGPCLADILRGGAIVGQATISRFFVIHVIVLPLITLAIIGFYLLMVQLHGMSTPQSVLARLKESGQKLATEKFFPEFLLKDLLVWILAFNMLAVLVTFYPWGLGNEADPFAPAPMGIKPEWYFLAVFQFLKILPAQIGPIEGEMFGIVFVGLLVMIMFLVPFWDTGKSKNMDKLATLYGLVLLLAFIGLTIWGALT